MQMSSDNNSIELKGEFYNCDLVGSVKAAALWAATRQQDGM